MTRQRPRSFRLESLEGKPLLSTLHVVHHPAPKPAALVLDGTLGGLRGRTPVLAADGQSHGDIPVTGTLRALGRVKADVIEDVQFGGAATPTTRDSIVIQGPKGSVTLGYGPDSVSEKVLSNSVIAVYRYAVESGTGAYAGASGTGTVSVTDPGAGWGFPTDRMSYVLRATR